MQICRNYIYERKIIEMGNIKNFFHKVKKFLKRHQYIMGVATSLTATAIVEALGSMSVIRSIPERFISMEESVDLLTEKLDGILKFDETMSTDLEDITSQIADLRTETNTKFDEYYDELSELKDYTINNIDELKQNIEKIDSRIFDLALKVSPTSSIENSIDQISDSVKNEKFLNLALVENTEVIAVDSLTQKTYKTEELINQKLLISYTEGENQEIFFYGQYNKNNHWDGDCIINVYENDNLKLITEANYNDGEILNYKQVFTYTTTSNVDVWSISERERINDGENDYNNGDSWNYYKVGEYRKDFEIDQVMPINILSVDEVKNSMTTHLEGYYHGNTKNGKYNDETGDAYLIKYFADGDIRTLYSGHFVDGKFNDTTNNAWYITKTEETDYMYYKGFFSEGVTGNNPDSYFENEIDNPERIKDILIENDFNLSLWPDLNNIIIL